MRYAVPVPSTYQGWPMLLASSTAPLTGVPALPGVPLATRRVAKVSGCPLLSVRWNPSNHDRLPLLLPTDALVSQAR